MLHVNAAAVGYVNWVVKDTQYILSFDVNEQRMIMVQKTHKVKERTHPYLELRLVNVTKQDKWSPNTSLHITYFTLERSVQVIIYLGML